jgi:hypothetical protein
MVPVLLIIYGVPLYNIGIFWMKLEVLVTRNDQGLILSIYTSEANNVKYKN